MRSDQEPRFLNDVRDHVMTVLRDDGVNRHVQFKRQNSFAYRFDLITWSGHLLITGDCGSWLFQRTEDMFAFFDIDRGDWNFEKDGISINPDYWSEKLLAVDASNRRGMNNGAKSFSEDVFKKEIKNYFDSYSGSMSEDAKSVAWQEIEDEVLCAESAESAYNLADSFSYHYNDDMGNRQEFRFQEIWEYDFSDWTFQYLWSCLAISWGIQQYKSAQSEETLAA